MIWVHFNEDEMHNWLKDNGCHTVDFDDTCLDSQIIVYEGPNTALVPVQISKIYYGYYVSKICTDLGIRVPERFVRLKQQLAELQRLNNEKMKQQPPPVIPSIPGVPIKDIGQVISKETAKSRAGKDRRSDES